MENCDLLLMILSKKKIEGAPNVFVNGGDFWLIRFDGGKTKLVRSLRGFLFIQYYLQNSGRQFKVEDLSIIIDRTNPTSRTLEDYSDQELHLCLTDTLTDKKSILEYEQRIDDLTEKIRAFDNGESKLSLEQINDCRKEKDFLEGHIKSVADKRKKPRRESYPLKKIRENVTGPIRDARKKLTEQDPAFGGHLKEFLDNRIKGGYFPTEPILWIT